MTLHIVKSAVVKVSIGPDDGNRVAHIARRGDVLPDGVSAEQVQRLLARGLIEKVAEVDPVQQTVLIAPLHPQEPGTEKPEQPTEKWTNEQLATYAGDHSIDISSAGKKAEAVEIITAELAKRAAGTEGQQA